MNNRKGGFWAGLGAAAVVLWFVLMAFIVFGLTFLGAREVWQAIF